MELNQADDELTEKYYSFKLKKHNLSLSDRESVFWKVWSLHGYPLKLIEFQIIEKVITYLSTTSSD